MHIMGEDICILIDASQAEPPSIFSFVMMQQVATPDSHLLLLLEIIFIIENDIWYIIDL